MQVLILDDDPAHRLMECRALRAALPQLELQQADQIAHAVTLLQQPPFPDLIVVDLNLNQEYGASFIRTVRLHPSGVEVPIIALSTSERTHDIEESYKAGASAYVVKSIDPAEFQKHLQRAAIFFLRK